MASKEWTKSYYKEAKPVHEALMKCYPLMLDDLPDEIWLPIFNYEELYHASNYGRLKSFAKGKPRILKPVICNRYLYIGLHKDGKNKSFQVHRLIARIFIPNPEGKPQINHIDGNKFNNHVSNLEWVTASENTRHAYLTGLQKPRQGEDHHKAKLTAEKVRLIRENPNGLTTHELATMFSVNQSDISQIQLGIIWKEAGGFIRGKIDTRTPDNIRNQIRAEYVYGSAEFGCCALAKKYGVDPTTISRIVHEKDLRRRS